MRFSIRNNSSFLIFAGLPVLFFSLFGNFGLDTTDRGFLPGLAYRILSGQVIYKDFFYVRPPLSPYLHSLEMLLFPANLEMVAYRMVYYLFVWLTVYWTVKSLMRFFDFEEMGVSPWLFASIGFLFSVGNNMVGPWHTVDGLFFSALGFFWLSRKAEVWNIALGLFCLGLAALCKQPFAVVPLFGLGFCVYNFGIRKAGIAAVAALGTAIGIFACIEFFLTPDFNFISAMLEQISGATKFSDLKWAGILLYVRPTVLVFGLGFGLWLILKKVIKTPHAGTIMAIYFFLGISAIAVGMGFQSYVADQFVKPYWGYYHALNGAAMLAGLVLLFGKHRKGAAFLLLMLTASWAGGISWGFPYPVYYSTPALFVGVFLLAKQFDFSFPKFYFPSLLGISAAGMLMLNLYVYADGPRSAISFDAGVLYPELSHIHTSEANYLEFAEFKELQTKHGDKFTVLPGFTFAHYLSHTTPIVPVDLGHDAELRKSGGVDQMILDLETSGAYVLAHRKELSHANSEGNYRCSTLAFVIENWTLVDSSAAFFVYKSK